MDELEKEQLMAVLDRMLKIIDVIGDRVLELENDLAVVAKDVRNK